MATSGAIGRFTAVLIRSAAARSFDAPVVLRSRGDWEAHFPRTFGEATIEMPETASRRSAH